MAHSYKLTYFNGQGRGECIRLILSYLGIKFEDKRVSWAEFEDVKKQTPLQMLPILEFDGKIIHQSISICRYLARSHNLAGKDEWDALQCDMIVDSLGDLYILLWEYRMAKEPEKTTLETTLKTVTLPKFLGYLNDVIKKNNGYTVGSKVTWSDISVSFCIEELLKHFPESYLKTYPDVLGLKEKIYAIPKIAEWVANRPAEDF